MATAGMSADMKICVTSKGSDMNSEMDERFGRCAYFAFYETESKKTEFVKNDFAEGSGGVGTKAAAFMAENKVSVLITGHVGDNADKGLKAAGIKVVNEKNKKIGEITAGY